MHPYIHRLSLRIKLESEAQVKEQEFLSKLYFTLVCLCDKYFLDRGGCVFSLLMGLAVRPGNWRESPDSFQ